MLYLDIHVIVYIHSCVGYSIIIYLVLNLNNKKMYTIKQGLN